MVPPSPRKSILLDLRKRAWSRDARNPHVSKLLLLLSGVERERAHRSLPPAVWRARRATRTLNIACIDDVESTYSRPNRCGTRSSCCISNTNVAECGAPASSRNLRYRLRSHSDDVDPVSRSHHHRKRMVIRVLHPYVQCFVRGHRRDPAARGTDPKPPTRISRNRRRSGWLCSHC